MVTVMDQFSRSWNALRAAVAELPPAAFDRPSGCEGWLVRDLVTHLVIDAQDVLITLATPVVGSPTRNAATYWTIGPPPDGTDPLDALTVRLAAAYGDPALLQFHLDDIGSAAGRAAGLADQKAVVGTQGQALTVTDYLAAYVLEWTLHHLDLGADIGEVPPPPAGGLAQSRRLFEEVTQVAFPAALDDTDTLLIGTGRRTPNEADIELLGPLADRLPFSVH